MTPAVDLSAAARAEQLNNVKLPTKRDEAWRYAPHRILGKLTFGPTAAPESVPEEIDRQLPDIDGPRVVLVNGVVDHERSNFTAVEGLQLVTLADAIAEQPELVAPHFAPAGDPYADAFVANNIAFGDDGAFIRIADDTTVETPVHVVDIAIPGTDVNTSCAGVVIHIGDRSSAIVVETRIGAGEEFGGANLRTSVVIGEQATLDHVILQDAPATQVNLSRTEVTQATGSEFRSRSFNLGGSYGRFGYHIELAGVGARADLSGLYFGLGSQTLDQQITVVHGAEDCTSRQSFRGVLDDASTGVFSGGIDVRPGADGTDAEQSNDNLVLSDRAEVNTQPRLEILADDVACVHGATVGQLDESALYYMRSRGIPGDEARRLLINGFADQAVDEVPIAAVRQWIAERLGHDLDVAPDTGGESVTAHDSVDVDLTDA
ncbi:MAG: Fe-S cluster assembly protein SufD [Actinomycetota bacterium]